MSRILVFDSSILSYSNWYVARFLFSPGVVEGSSASSSSCNLTYVYAHGTAFVSMCGLNIKWISSDPAAR